MNINISVQIHWFWFKLQDLSHTNVKKKANLASTFYNESSFITILKRFFVTSNKYTEKAKIICA